jgi:hypothetical protein
MTSYKLVVQAGDLEVLNGCDIQCEILSPEFYMCDWETGLPVVLPGYTLMIVPAYEETTSFMKLKFGERFIEIV